MNDTQTTVADEAASLQKKKTPDIDAGSLLAKLANFFKDDPVPPDVKYDESDYYIKQQNLVKLVRRQSIIILSLVFLLIIGSIFLQPINKYYLRWPGPEKKVEPLISLTEPNLTDQAILSWVATSITEILTFGFGDIDQRIISQANRFTSDGWDSFVNVLRERNMREDFKMRQLVLTTVPADMPVIVAKGLDEDFDYTWVVEMPIVMTYTTNNNVTRGHKNIVRLTLARIPSLENKAGIGIKMWKML